MKKISTMAAAALICLGGASATVGPLHAQDLELELGQNGPRLRLKDGECDPRRQRCPEDTRRGFRDSDRETRRVCTEDRALDKAERLGVRRARVVAAGRRVIEVSGRDRYGDRVEMTFGRDRNCPVVD